MTQEYLQSGKSDEDRMYSLISTLCERDPEHGEADVVLNFCDQYGPENWHEIDGFDCYEFARTMPTEYAEMLEEYIADYPS